MLPKDYFVKTLRESAVLTTGYVAGTVIGFDAAGVRYQDQLNVYVDFTIGSLTSLQIKAEYSPDNSTWFQETFSSVSGGTDTMTLGEHSVAATGKYRLSLPIKDAFIRISVKGTGTVTNSLCAVSCALGQA